MSDRNKIWDFFDGIRRQILTNIEIYNEVEKLTSFDTIKINMLLDDFIKYYEIYQEKEEREKSENEKIKLDNPEPLYNDDIGPVYHPSHQRNDYDFKGCERFVSLLKSLIEDRPGSVNQEFYEYFTYDKPIELADKIKQYFPNAGGKDYALLIKILEKRNPKILFIPSGGRNNFVKAMLKYINCKIKLASVNKYLRKGNELTDIFQKEEILEMEKTINKILSSIE